MTYVSESIQSGVALTLAAALQIGTPGRTRTRNLDVRSVALFRLSYRSEQISDREFRIADLKTDVRLSRQRAYSDQSAIRNPKSAIHCWSGRTELNCHHEFPGLGCLRYTTPRFEGFKFQVHSFKFANET